MLRNSTIAVAVFHPILALVIVLPLMLASRALAGPPLICHEINIGDAKSLPWGKDAFEKGGSYSLKNVVNDTLEILSPNAPVFVRMETLRRAALYVDRNQTLADELLGKLMARALDAEAAGKPDAMAWLDAGYFTASCAQLGISLGFGPAVTKGTGASAVPGYAWVKRAISLQSDTIELHAAAALMTVDHRGPEHESHLRQLLASSVAQSEPGKGLATWMAEIQGTTIDALRAKYGLTDARRGD